jgi:cell division protein FtsB
MNTQLDRGLLPRRMIAILTGLAALYLVLLIGQRALDAYRINQEIESIRREIIALQSRNVELQGDLSSPRAEEEIERIAREELGFVRPGDRSVILLWPEGHPPTSDRAPSASAVGISTPEPHWRSWLRLFVDLDAPYR